MVDPGARAAPDPAAASFETVFAEEQKVLTARNYGRTGAAAPAAGDYSTGLCLSGGGIRSSTVSLGVLQALAGAGLIKHFDYLSSVSGGGYIASALTLRYAQRAGAETDPDAAFPFGQNSDALARLRHAANYLAPRGAASMLTGFVVVARSLVLNVFIWLFLGGLAFAVLMAVFYEGTADCDFLPWMGTGVTCHQNALFYWLLVLATLLGTVLAALVVGFSLSGWRMTVKPAVDGPGAEPGVPRIRLALAGAAAAAAIGIVWLMPEPSGLRLLLLTVPALVGVWSLTPMVGPKWPPRLLTLGLALLLAGILAAAWWFDRDGFWGDSRSKVALLVSAGLLLLLLRRRGGTAGAAPAELSPKYARRRVQERWSGRLLLGIVLALLFAVVPFVPTVLSDLSSGKPPSLDTEPVQPNFWLLVVYLLSAGAALFGYYRTRLQGVLGRGTTFVLIAGSLMLFYATVILAYAIALQLLPAVRIPVNGEDASLSVSRAALIAGVIAAFALAVFVNINDVSLGRYYRDRLLEAFMPDRTTGVDDLDAPATEADAFRLTQIVGPVAEEERPERVVRKGLGGLFRTLVTPTRGEPRPSPPPLLGPYPLINTHIVRRRSPDAVRRRRGGDSFLLSPLYCGSTETGWKPTHEVIEGELTLPTAMAISGAAANPGGGLAGRGVTTNFAVVVAMSFLSLRLGYRFRWAAERGFRRWMNPFGNHLIPAASEVGAELLGLRSDRDTFIELSDGGHFENLGLYELVRRRCGFVVVVDGGQDPTSAYEALVSAMTLIREDFSTTLDFNYRVRSGRRLEPSGPAQVVARAVPDEYPKSAEFARRGYFLGTICYPKAGTTTRVPMADGPDLGHFIYLKSAMIPALSLPSRGYKGANPDFPYESTMDQFFSPEQFEAYRDVGRAIAEQMLKETKLETLFRNGRPPLARLRRNYVFLSQ